MVWNESNEDDCAFGGFIMDPDDPKNKDIILSKNPEVDKKMKADMRKLVKEVKALPPVSKENADMYDKIMMEFIVEMLEKENQNERKTSKSVEKEI